MKKLFIGMLAVNLLTACASYKPISKVEEKLFPVVNTSDAEISAAPGSDASLRSTEFVNADPLDTDLKLKERSIYYPFDIYVVQDADKPTVQAHAQYLSEHDNSRVRLEGHCDERGSNEYNLALGQRRADGVKKMLEIGGAKDSQIESISYGEEKPEATGHDKASWAKNRRTDFKYH